MCVLVVGLSAVLQVVAACLALNLFRLTGRRLAWALVSIALFTMALRRVVTLYEIFVGGPHVHNHAVEVLGLLISILMLAGIRLIRPYFETIRNSEQMARESESRYRRVVEMADELILTTDIRGKCQFANRKALEVSGYTLDELKDKSYLDLVDPSFRRRMQTFYMRQYLRHERTTRFEFPFMTKEGETVWLSQNATLIMSGEDVIGFHVVARDVTERKEAADELQLLNKTLLEERSIFVSGNVVVFKWKNAEGWPVEYASPNTANVFGYTAEQFMSGEVSYAAIIPPEYINRVAGEVMEHSESGVTCFEHEDYPVIRQDGREIWLHDCTTILRDDKGTITHYVGYVVDVTERRRAEQDLRLTQFAVEHVGDAVYFVDLNGFFFYTNEAACRLLGYSEDELLSMSVPDVDPSLAESEWETRRDRLKQAGVVSFESTHKTKAGHLVPVEITANYVEFEGQEFLCVFVRDITERKRAARRERELQGSLSRARRMESLGLLAGGVAHDLNNILGPIVAYPDLILDRLQPGHPVREDVLRMQDAAKRAAAVIQDLLALSRRGSYQLEPIDLNTVIDSYLHSAGFLDLKKHRPDVVLNVNLGDGISAVNGSAPHLAQVVMNLVINAYEAVPHGGLVSVVSEEVTVDRPLHLYEKIEPGKYVVLHVADTGRGIAEGDIEHVFEPFFTRKRLGRSGSGLGLAVVYGVVKDNEGFIDVRSTVGKGTEFTLYLPSAGEAAEVLVAAAEEDYCGSERILVVDDIKSQRELAQRILGSLGYKVDTACGSDDALERVRSGPYDLVILDMILEEDCDGLDLYRRISHARPGQRCIIASGFSESDRVKEAQRLGAGRFVQKPYTRDNIGRSVRAELDQVS